MGFTNQIQLFSHICPLQYAKLAISLRVPGGVSKKKAAAAAAPAGGASGAADDDDDEYAGGLC